MQLEILVPGISNKPCRTNTPWQLWGQTFERGQVTQAEGSETLEQSVVGAELLVSATVQHYLGFLLREGLLRGFRTTLDRRPHTCHASGMPPRRPFAVALGLLAPTLSDVSFGQTLELALHAGAALPSETEESLAAVAFTGGATANVRLGEHLALGALVQHVYVPWKAQGDPGFAMAGSLFPDEDGSLEATLIAPNLRWYITRIAYTELYAQAAVGYARYATFPEHPDCSFDLPIGVQLSAGLDVELSTWTRLGFSGGAQTLHFGKACTELGYQGRAPDPPSPSLAFAGQLVFTTVWSRPNDGDSTRSGGVQ